MFVQLKLMQALPLIKETLLKNSQIQRQEEITPWVLEMLMSDEGVITFKEKLLEKKT